jgi:hypothetical protein
MIETRVPRIITPRIITPTGWREFIEIHPAAELFPLTRKCDPTGYAQTREDIHANGLRVTLKFWDDPVTFDRSLLDGRNRLEMLAEIGVLGVSEDDEGFKELVYVKEFRNGAWVDLKKPEGVLFEDRTKMEVLVGDPWQLVLSLNVYLRHLSAEQKRVLIADILKARPEQSNRAIAKQVHADHKTVAAVRGEKEATGEIPQLEKTVGADGKSRSAARKKKPNRPDRPPSAAASGGNPQKEISADAMKENFAQLDAEVNPEHGDGPPDAEITGRAKASESVTAKLPAESRGSVAPKDVALIGFTERVLDLAQRISKHKPERFVGTAVPTNELIKLAKFFAELADRKKSAAKPEDKAACARHRGNFPPSAA